MLFSDGTNGIALWMDWDYGGLRRTTGTDESGLLGKDPKWHIGCKQGVFFLPPKLLKKPELTLNLKYENETGDVTFNFV